MDEENDESDEYSDGSSYEDFDEDDEDFEDYEDYDTEIVMHHCILLNSHYYQLLLINRWFCGKGFITFLIQTEHWNYWRVVSVFWLDGYGLCYL